MRYVFLLTILCYIASAVSDLDLALEPLLCFIAASIIMSLRNILLTILHFRKHPLKNYPARYRKGARTSWLDLGYYNLAIGSIAGISAYLAVFHGKNLFALIFALSGTAFLFMCLMTPGWIREVLAVTILPYFKERIGHIDTFISGQVLARRVCILDALAAELGLTRTERPLRSAPARHPAAVS